MQKEAFCAPTVYTPVRYVQGIKTTGGTMVNTYLTDLRYRDELARIRAEFFPDGKLPASTLVGVAGLADPDMLVEIEAVAVIPET